jgi:hypothetical protein
VLLAALEKPGKLDLKPAKGKGKSRASKTPVVESPP